MTQHTGPTGNRRARWLLPFTTEVDLPTIDSVLHLAEAGGATLVAVSFLVAPGGRRAQNIRLELLQQSQDFLEAVRCKSQQLALPVECHEVVTHDLRAEIARAIQQLECQSVVLASKDEHTLFVPREVLQELVLHPPVQLLLLRFSAEARAPQSGWVSKLFSWVRSLGRSETSGYAAHGMPGSRRRDISEAPEVTISKKEA